MTQDLRFISPKTPVSEQQFSGDQHRQSFLSKWELTASNYKQNQCSKFL